jgi:hypothetical protein
MVQDNVAMYRADGHVRLSDETGRAWRVVFVVYRQGRHGRDYLARAKIFPWSKQQQEGATDDMDDDGECSINIARLNKKVTYREGPFFNCGEGTEAGVT